MYIPDLVIPLNREEFLNTSTAGQFYVREEYSVEELCEKLEAAKITLNEEGTDFIVDHFSTYFWLCQKFKQCSQLVREKGWKTIRKGFGLLSKNLQVFLEDATDMDPEAQHKIRNITKMIVYALIELMKVNQNFYSQQATNTLDGKTKKKQVKVSSEDGYWNAEKHSVFVDVHTFLQLPIKMLWEPPVVEEEFVNLIANFCYTCLEDPNISSASEKALRETIFQILGILVKNYLHGLSFCVKVVQLLRMNDHLVVPLAQGIIQLVSECGCGNVVKEIVREVADTDGDQLATDTEGTRNLNLFLVQLAAAIPETLIPAMKLLVNHLNGDSYSMRTCVLGVLGEVVVAVLTKEDLDERLKKLRDEYLNHLEEHIHDTNAFVRTKALQVWQKLCVGKAIPISRLNGLLRLVVGRLNDKNTIVKKQAIHLIKDLLEGNPFCGQLNVSDIQSQLQQEKRKLESIEKEHNLKSDDTRWREMEPKLKELLEGDIDELDVSGDSEFVSVESVISVVGKYLVTGEYAKAIAMIVKLESEFYAAFDIKSESASTEAIVDILHNIFKQTSKPLLNASPEIQDQVEKCSKTIEYLESALEFSQLIDRALPIILTFLDSSAVTEVLEAIRFFTAAYLFGFKQALEGVRKMLHLVFSKEDHVKAAVSLAYKQLYFQTTGSGRQQSLATVKNLSELVLKLNFIQLDALEEVIKDWVKANLIDKNCVQIMFEKFSMKFPGTGKDQCWAALVLIRMVGAEEAKIIKSNLSVLLQEGLRNHGAKNFLIAKETCRALQHLLPPKVQGKVFDHTLRYPKNHEAFQIIYDLLRTGIWRMDDSYFIPLAEEAVNLVFAICDQPDEFCKSLIVDLHGDISRMKRPFKRTSSPGKNNLYDVQDREMGFSLEEEGKEEEMREENVEENDGELFVTLLTRFISILGQVAANYILYLEGPVLDELKLRNQLDYEKKMKKFEESKKFNTSIKKSRGVPNESRFEKNLNDVGSEDLEFNRVAADDMDTEEMRKITENTIVTGKGFLAKFTPLVVTICRNPGKYNSEPLQNAALLTLAKFMQVSSIFCEENLQLLVTICEKSHFPERQENAIIALGALQYRFPNCLEPWTPHMYAMLRNPNPSVRYSSILVLTDLIVNEMIKVRAHVSSLAICIVDKEIKIARVARNFFREYSQKGNSLYNVLPNLISNLTQSNSPLDSEEFKTIMKYIMGLLTKEKQFECLIEKLCQYFESATTERQWCDLAYCLSLLHYNEKGVKKLIENVRSFAGKLYLAEVYEAFCTITSNAGKNPKDKAVVNDLHATVQEYRNKSCEDKGGCAVKRKTCPPSTKKRPTRRKYLPSDSEDEEFERKTRKRRNSLDED